MAQHQIQRLMFASQQPNVSNFSWICNAEKHCWSAAQAKL